MTHTFPGNGADRVAVEFLYETLNGAPQRVQATVLSSELADCAAELIENPTAILLMESSCTPGGEEWRRRAFHVTRIRKWKIREAGEAPVPRSSEMDDTELIRRGIRGFEAIEAIDELVDSPEFRANLHGRASRHDGYSREEVDAVIDQMRALLRRRRELRVNMRHTLLTALTNGGAIPAHVVPDGVGEALVDEGLMMRIGETYTLTNRGWKAASE